MKRAIIPLLAILALQTLLLIQQRDTDHSIGAGTAGPPLAGFKPEQVTEIRIDDELENQAVLHRAGDNWTLPRLGHAPADAERVNALLETLSTPNHGWPVADTATARQRLQVADYYFKRRLTFYALGLVADKIYLGSAPAFKRVHARNGAQEAIYSISFNEFEAPARDDAWLDRHLLQVRTPTAIVADAYSLHWQDGSWISGSGGNPDERELQVLLGSLRNLKVEGIADAEAQRMLYQAESDLVLNIESLTGKTTLELFSQGAEHYIHSSEYRLFFKLSTYEFDRLSGIDFHLISGDPARPVQAIR